MEMHEVFAWAIAGASVVTAALTSAAKLRWSKEFVAAKDETIRAKDAQVHTLKERIAQLESLTPPALRDIHDACIHMYENGYRMFNRRIEGLQDVVDRSGVDLEALREAVRDAIACLRVYADHRDAMMEYPLGAALYIEAFRDLKCAGRLPPDFPDPGKSVWGELFPAIHKSEPDD